MSRIFLIRHGETDGNAARIVQRPEIPLSPRGESQAEALALRLARAVATAERLQRATGAPVSFDPLLQERNFGDVRGTAYDDLGFYTRDTDFHRFPFVEPVDPAGPSR